MKALKIATTIIVGFPVAIALAAVIEVVVVVALVTEAVAWAAGKPTTHCPGHQGFRRSQ